MASVSTISGVSSGIDWQATVDALMQVEKRKVTLLETRQTAQQQRLDAWRSLNTRLLALQNSMDSLEEASSFLVNTAASTDADLVQATASSTAGTGSYAVLVDQLAGAARLVHRGWSDADTTVINNSGTDQVFAYTYGSGDDAVSRSVVIPTGTTLQGLRDLVNQDTFNPGVRASLLNDGSGSATAWHLVLAGEDSGASAQLVLDDALTTLGDGANFDNATFEVSQTAQNARFRVNGYPAAGWLESASNTVTDALEGITLTLKATTAGEEVGITVSRDTSAVKAKIQAFVTSFNEILTQINAYSNYNTTTKSMGILLGDAGLNQLKRSLTQIASRNMTGLPEDATYESLGQIGLKSGQGGLLSIDAVKLDAALADHPQELADLFTFNARSSNSALSFFARTTEVPAGELLVSASYDADGVLLSGTIGGQAALVNGAFLSAATGSTFDGLKLLFRSPGSGPGTVNTTLTLGHGMAAALMQTLGRVTNSETGLVQYQTVRLESAVSSLAKSIEDMNTRLTSKRAELERSYRAMETAMARMQSQSSAISQLTQQNNS